MKAIKSVGRLIASLGISLLAGFIGSLATTPNINGWYADLTKPPLVPPNEVFGPVWITLYIMMGIALFLVWNAKKSKTPFVYVSFFLQLVLNTGWSLAFFGLQLPWLGSIVIILLISAIIWNIFTFKDVSKPAALLLTPYLAWVCFATYLTFGVMVLN